MVANPVCDQKNRENDVFLSPFASESLVSRDSFNPPASAHSFFTPIIIRRIYMVLTHGLFSFLPLSATVSAFIRQRNCVSMAFNAVSPPAQGL